MSATSINILTDDELKVKAQSVFTDLGMDMSTAINAFLSQVVNKQAIPFEIPPRAVKRAKLGGWEGKIFISPDFDEPMEEFAEYRYEKIFAGYTYRFMGCQKLADANR